MQPLFIGIAGISEVGKTTAAEYLQTNLTLACLALATPIKEACAAMLGLNPAEFMQLNKSTHIAGLNCTVRQLMQNVGDAMLKNNNSALTALCDLRILDALNAQQHFFNGFIIEDLRTNHECEWLREKKGLVIHVLRDVKPAHAHRTEQHPEIKQEDAVIKNYSNDKTELIDKLAALATNIKQNKAA